MNIIEGQLTTPKGKFAILVARFNSYIVESLLDGAVDTLKRHGVSENNIEVIRVPGAFEIPIIAKTLLEEEKPDCVIALGCIIRGGTGHADLVATSVTHSLQQLALEFQLKRQDDVLILIYL